jgi:hypothetical protein
MNELNRQHAETLKELIVATLAMTDAITKILIEKGLISEVEFREKLCQEREVYQDLLKPNSHG